MNPVKLFFITTIKKKKKKEKENIELSKQSIRGTPGHSTSNNQAEFCAGLKAR
jgi:hypothetical protein